MRSILLGTCLLSFAALSPLAGQAVGPTNASLTLGMKALEGNRGETLQGSPGQVSMGRLILGGAVGFGVAVLATRLVYQANGGGRICGDDPCGMYPAILTLMIAEPILIPVGVHAANHGRGSLGGTFFSSLLTAGAMLLVGNWIDMGDAGFYITPPVQILAAALVQRASEGVRSPR